MEKIIEVIKIGRDNKKRKSHLIDLQCATCGKNFLRQIGAYNRNLKRNGKRNYCSGYCEQKRGVKKKFVKICKICGKEFSVWNFRKDKAKYCSFRCRNIDILKNQRGRKESSIEKIIRGELEKMKIKFLPQYYLGLGGGRCDFYIPDHRLIIQCDGDYWHSIPKTKEADKKQEWFYGENGYNYCRLAEKRIKNDLPSCIKDVKLLLNSTLTYNV